MSTTEYISDGLAVTRYAGPGDTPGPHRIRIRIDSRSGSVYGIDVLQAIDIAKALVTLALTGVYGDVERSNSDGIH